MIRTFFMLVVGFSALSCFGFAEEGRVTELVDANQVTVELEPCYRVVCYLPVGYHPKDIVVKMNGKTIARTDMAFDAVVSSDDVARIELSRIVLHARLNHFPLKIVTDKDLNILRFKDVQTSTNAEVARVELKDLPLEKSKIQLSTADHKRCRGHQCLRSYYGRDLQVKYDGLLIGVSGYTTYTKVGEKNDFTATEKSLKETIASTASTVAILQIAADGSNCLEPRIGEQGLTSCENKGLLPTDGNRGVMSLLEVK